MKPTKKVYSELEQAYDFFNAELFEGKLPSCVISLQRKNRTYGYFSANRFLHRGGDTTDEIAMNPSFFSVVPIAEICQTLVHEMAHQWQEHFGTPGRRGYHNKEWGNKMEAIGLMPSSTGEPGGDKTGEQMMDYIIPGGLFEEALNSLLTEEFTISWCDRHPPIETIREIIKEEGLEAVQDKLEQWGVTISENDEVEPVAQAPKPTRIKFTCPSCNANLWGKPSLNVLCLDCDVSFVENGF